MTRQVGAVASSTSWIACPTCRTPAGQACAPAGDHFARVVKAEAIAADLVEDQQSNQDSEQQRVEEVDEGGRSVA